MSSSLVARAMRCREAYLEAKEGFREVLYDNLREMYCLLGLFAEKRNQWRRFIKDQFWATCAKKPDPGADPSAMMLWLTRFMVSSRKTDGPLYNRAYKYARALKKFAEMELTPDEVREKLSKHGVDYFSTSSAVGLSGESGRANPRSGERTVASERVENPSLADPEDLSVEVTPELLMIVLGLEVGKRARLTIKRVAQAKERPNWVRIRGVKVTKLS